MATSTMSFQDGGKLKENSFYIEREADRLLYDYLLNGDYCSILDPRQVGKSSLMERTSQKLMRAGVKCGYLDMQSLASSEVSFEKLINSLLFTICRSLGIKADALAFLKKYKGLSANKILELFFREVVFPAVDAESSQETKIVLFVDEVDIVKYFKPTGRTSEDGSEGSSIGDDFFLTFRSLHEIRTSPPFNRLAICFAGVAFAGDLVSRPDISPFNVGKRIILSDFTLDEMQAFKDGLSAVKAEPQALIEEVYEWTSGHPYMSQRVFLDLTKCDFKGGNSKEIVAERVNQLFLLPNISPDANLAYAVKRLTSPNESEEAKNRRPQILETFLRVKRADGKKILLDKDLTDTPSYDETRLIGLTSFTSEADGSYLKIRNRIYDTFFTDEWVNNKISEQREFRPFFERWLRYDKIDDYLLRGSALESAVIWAAGREDITLDEREFIDKSQQFNQKQLLTALEARRARTFRIAAVLTAVLALIAFSMFGATGYLYSLAEEQRLIAQSKQREAEVQTEFAVEQTNLAQNKSQEAQEQREIAEDRTEQAQRQKTIAENKSLEAEQQTKVAQRERLEAQKQKTIAEKERSEAQKQEKIALGAKEDAESAEAAAKRAEERTDLYSRFVLRQERSTQTKYNEEQQSAFRKDAANIAVNLAKLGSNTSIDVDSVLPKSLTNTNSQEKDITQLSEGRFENYAGELTRGKKTANYFAEVSDFSSVRSADKRYLTFWDQNDETSTHKFTLPMILNYDGYYYSSINYIASIGDSLFIRVGNSPYFFDTKKKQLIPVDLSKSSIKNLPNSKIETPDRVTITSIFNSKKNNDRLALLQERYIDEQQTLLLFDRQSGIYDELKGDFFSKITDEDVLYISAGNLETVNIISGVKTDLQLKVKYEDESEESLYLSFFNEKTRNLAILKLFVTSRESRRIKAVLNVFNLSKKEIVIPSYDLSDENLISDSSFKYYGRADITNLIKFSPDGNHLLYRKMIETNNELTKTELKVIDIPDYEKGKKAKTIKDNSIVNKIFFLPDGKRAVIWETFYGTDGEEKDCLNIYNWKDLADASDEVKSGFMPCKFQSQKDFQFSYDYPVTFFAPDNKIYSFAGDADGTIRAIDLENISKPLVFSENISPNRIRKIEVDGSELSTTSEKGVYSRILYEKGAFRLKDKLDLKDYSISSPFNIKVSPTFDQIADFTEKTVRIWKKSGELSDDRLILNDDVRAIEYFPDGKRLLAAGSRQAVLWDSQTKKQIDIAKPFIDKFTDKRILPQINSISVSNSGDYSLVEFKNGYVIYDVKSGKSYPSEPFWEDETAVSNDYKIIPPTYASSDSYRSWGVTKYPLGSPTRFSPDDKFLVVVNEVNKKEQLVSDIFKEELSDYLKSNNVTRNIVRIIDVESRDVVKEFFIDNFKYAKFSSDGSMVALFANGQCFIAHTGKYASNQALLIPLEGVTFGDFSKNGDKFITIVSVNSGKNKTVHIFDTKDSKDTKAGNLSYKYDLPLPEVTNKEKAAPINQEIYFVKFSEDSDVEIEIGRGVYFQPARNTVVSSTENTNSNSNSNSNSNGSSSTQRVYYANTTNANIAQVLVPSKVKTQLSSKVQSEIYTKYDCYRIKPDGMLVAESRCGVSANEK
jgi:hypothetical protein